MTRPEPFLSPFLAGVAAAVSLLAGCASTPSTPGTPSTTGTLGTLGTSTPSAAPTAAATPATLDCAALGAQVTQAEQDRDAALQQQRDAWKVVVPFAVAARHARARHSVANAEQRLAEMQAEFGRRGCDRPGA